MSYRFDEESHIYVQLAELLRNEVYEGQISGRLPSLQELAKTYSVNFKTANKAISMLVGEGLLFRARGRGTFVAKASATTREHVLVGLLLPDIENPFFAKLADALQHAAFERNLAVVVSTTKQDPRLLSSSIQAFKAQRVRALVVQGGVLRTPDNLSILKGAGIPAVGFHTRLTEIDNVSPDMKAGAQMATEQMLNEFGPPVAFISGSDEPAMRTGRFYGYRDAHLALSQPLDPRMLRETNPTYRGGYESTVDLLKQSSLPRSIFYYNDLMAMGGLSAIRSMGKDVPADIAMTGCDDSVNVEEMLVPFTTVCFPYEEIANQLTSLLERRLSNPAQPPLSVRIAPKLIIRDSSRARASRSVSS